MIKTQQPASTHGPQGTSVLEISGLSVRYGPIAVVRDVGFTVRGGEVFGILGPSGAGKSTILAALTGIVRSTGRISLNGKDLSHEPPRRRRFGNVYQDLRLFNWMTVYRNIAFGCEAQGWDHSRTAHNVQHVAERMGLSTVVTRAAGHLSGGQKQRVALARALAFEPQALFLDEPFSDLDPPLRIRLRRDMVQHVAGRPIPVILVTHDRGEALELCDRLAILLDGTLQQVGEPSALLQAPASLPVAEFIGYSNRIHGMVTAIEDARVEMLTADGPCYATAPGPLPKLNTPAVAVCRPVSVIPVSSKEPMENTFAFTLDSVHVVEDFHLAALTAADGNMWTAHWMRPLGAIPGRQMRCRVAPSDLLVFPGI